MRILTIQPQSHGLLTITAEDGRIGLLDVRPYLEFEAFLPLRDPEEFNKVSNGGYFIEWDCGADLSADTIEVTWQDLDAALDPSIPVMANHLLALPESLKTERDSAPQRGADFA